MSVILLIVSVIHVTHRRVTPLDATTDTVNATESMFPPETAGRGIGTGMRREENGGERQVHAGALCAPSQNKLPPSLKSGASTDVGLRDTRPLHDSSLFVPPLHRFPPSSLLLASSAFTFATTQRWVAPHAFKD